MVSSTTLSCTSRFGAGCASHYGSRTQKESPGARPGPKNSKSKFRSRLLALCRNVLGINGSLYGNRNTVRCGGRDGRRSTGPIDVARLAGRKRHSGDERAQGQRVGSGGNLGDMGAVIPDGDDARRGGEREGRDTL